MRTNRSHLEKFSVGRHVLIVAGSCIMAHVVAQEGVTRTAAVPPAPMLVSRVEPFRQLLAADVPAREKMLASRPEAQREQFRKALRDYDSLPSDERERRLQALELRFQLTYLIPMAPEARTQALARFPAASQPLIRERLDYWNQLSPEVQKELLVSERLMRDFINRIVSVRHPPMPGGVLNSNLLGRINQAASSWNSLPESKRAAVDQAFRKVFELGSTEAATGILPPAELEEMRQALERFKHLSPAGRRSVLVNSERLMGMSPEERQVFLRSAEEWQKLSPKDREAWRSLVKKLPVFPPDPPGLRTPRRLPEPSSLSATNAETHSR